MCSSASKKDEAGRLKGENVRHPFILHPSSLILLFLLFLLFLSACTTTPPVVKVGLVAPFEGRERAVGYDVIYSARLAVREINAAGGIGGYRVALVALDDGGDPQLASETAASLTIDPAIIAVLGHWQPQTTAVAHPLYTDAGLPFLPMGDPPFGPTNPAELPPDFVSAYEAVTPFDEAPGPYAATTYAAFQQLWEVMDTAVQSSGELSRASLQNAWPEQP